MVDFTVFCSKIKTAIQAIFAVCSPVDYVRDVAGLTKYEYRVRRKKI